MTSCRKIVTSLSLSFFQFMEKLEQFGSRIPHAESVKCAFSLTVTLHITKTGEKIAKTEDRSKKSVTHLSHYSFDETIFAKRCWFFCKICDDISIIKKTLVYFLELHMRVYLRAKVQVSSKILTSFKTGRVILPPPHTSKRNYKKPT